MTKLRRKLLLSVLTLALTFIALGSTTFAWFTLGNEVTANALNGDIQAGKGIDVYLGSISDNAWDTVEWKSSIDLSTLSLSDNFEFKDLTSEDGEIIKAQLGATPTKNTDYIEFDLYVRAFSEPSTISLTKVTSTTDDENWYPDVAIADEWEINSPVAWNALNALRVSFVTTGTTVGDAKVIEWNTSSGHRGADSSTSGLAYKYAQVRCRPVEAGGTVLAAGSQTTVLATPTADTNVELKGSTFTAIANANGYYYYKITVRMWMEGWDGDCIDAILGRRINFGFNLTATFPNA